MHSVNDGSGTMEDPNASAPTGAMRALSAELVSLATSCGLPEHLLGYLKDRQILSAGLLAAMADTYKEVDEMLYVPLRDGVTVEGHMNGRSPKTKDTLSERPCASSGSGVAHRHNKMATQGAQWVSRREPGLVASEPAPSKAVPAVPREIPPAELQKLLKFYSDTQIAGRNRDFPMKALVGAEKVMARIWHEKWISSQFTPTQLHELLEARCFDSSGSLNTLNKEMKQKQQSRLTVDEEQNAIVIEEEQQWSPKGLLGLMDALEAIELCWILCQLGHELDVKEYISWWRQLFRSRPGKIEQIKAYWTDARWKVALSMRQGYPFDQAMQQIIDDAAALQAALMKELGTTKPPPKKPQSRPQHQKGKGYGKSDRAETSTWTSSQSSQDRPWKREWPQWKSQDGWQSQPWKKPSAGKPPG